MTAIRGRAAVAQPKFLTDPTFLREDLGRIWKHFPSAVSPQLALSWPDFSRFVRAHWYDRELVRVVRDGKTVEDLHSQDSNHWRGRVHLDRLLASLEDGASIVLEETALDFDEIADFTYQFERTFKEEIYSQIFLSGPTTRGFGLHWDPYDVFAVQIVSSRVWNIFGPTRPHPRSTDAEAAPLPGHPAIAKIVMLPGDVLYLPRGFWHEVETSEKESAHLTLGIPRRTGIDFIEWARDKVCAHEVARRDLPRFSSPEDRRLHIDALKDALFSLLDEKSMLEYLDDWDGRAPGRPRPSFHHANNWDASGLTELRSLIPRAQIFSTETHVRLVADGRTFEFDSVAAAAIDYIVNQGRCSYREARAASGLVDAEFAGLINELRFVGLVSID